MICRYTPGTSASPSPQLPSMFYRVCCFCFAASTTVYPWHEISHWFYNLSAFRYILLSVCAMCVCVVYVRRHHPRLQLLPGAPCPPLLLIRCSIQAWMVPALNIKNPVGGVSFIPTISNNNSSTFYNVRHAVQPPPRTARWRREEAEEWNDELKRM